MSKATKMAMEEGQTERHATLYHNKGTMYIAKFDDGEEAELTHTALIQGWTIHPNTHTTPKTNRPKPIRALPKYEKQPSQCIAITYNMQDYYAGKETIAEIAYTLKPMFILGQETHLHGGTHTTQKNKYNIPIDYRKGPCFGSTNWIAKKRTRNTKYIKRASGGVMLLMRKDVAQNSTRTRVEVPQLLINYMIHIIVKTASNVPLHIICAYAPHNKPEISTYLWHCIQQETQKATANGEGILVGGDFNADTTKISGIPQTHLATQLRKVTCKDLTKADPADVTPTYHAHNLTSNKRIDDWLIGGDPTWVAKVTGECYTRSTNPKNNRSDHWPVEIICNPSLFCIHDQKYGKASNKEEPNHIMRVQLPIKKKNIGRYKTEMANLSFESGMELDHNNDMEELLKCVKDIGLETCAMPVKAKRETNANTLNRKQRQSRERTIGTVQKITQYMHPLTEQYDEGEKATVWKLNPHAVEIIKLTPHLYPTDIPDDTNLSVWRAHVSATCRHLRREWKTILRNDEKKKIEKSVNKLRLLLHTSPRMAHRKIFSKQNERHVLEKTYNPDGTLTTNQSETLNAIREEFTGLAAPQKFDPTTTPEWTKHVHRPTGTQKPHKELTRELYQYIVARLPNNKSPGPDGVRNEWLKEAPMWVHDKIYSWLLNFWDKAEELPAWFTASTTVLLYKKGYPNLVGNYRPIALAQTVYKLYTKCLAHIIQEYAETNYLLSNTQ